MSRITLAFVGFVLAGCQSLPASEAARSEVQAATQAWVAAFNESDAAKTSSLYLPEAALWGTVSPTLISTQAGIRQYFERGFSANPLKVAVGEQLVRVYGDIAINSGSYTFTRTVQGQPRSNPARFSFTYRKVNGQWRIADHHSSLVPVPPAAAPAPSR
jgi:uncharacterized protein (TIGR02246 family)